LSEIAHQVADAFLGPVDQVSVGRVVDRVGHRPQGLLEVLAHPPDQLVPIDLRQAVHGNSFFSPSSGVRSI